VHRDFADWYRIAAIELSGEMLEKRWQAIETFVESLDIPGALELVRLFYARPPKDSSFIETYRAAFKDTDPTFPMRDNDLELRVLAGAAIAHLLETDTAQLADATALGMVCAGYRGLRQDTSIPEIADRARNYLFKRSSSLRASKEVPTFVIPELEITELLESLKRSCQGNDLATLAEPIIPPFEKLQSAIRQLAESTENAINCLTDLQQLRREESNILWWLFGEYSRDLNRRMADLGLPAACLVAAKELADLTVVLPGPLAATAFLDKMLRTIKPKLPDSTTLQKAVNASPREWRSRWIRKDDVELIEDLCPVLLAIMKSLETDGPDDWVPAFEKAAGIKVSESILPLDLACQAYEENLLVRAVERCR
jgi:hypothetical protein